MNTNRVIFDTHYTPEEYSGSDGCGGRKGWGYSTWKYAVALCREANVGQANVGQLTLTHHGHEDVEIEKMGEGDEPIKIGGLEGNKFIITVRNLEKEKKLKLNL